MRVGSLCTGYGGIELGLALAGETPELAFIAETGPTARLPHFAGVDNLGDITGIDWAHVAASEPPIDLLTAGFPCQPVSAAGRQRGDADERWLWPHVRDAIAAIRPPRVLLENVRNLVSIQKGALWQGILDDLTGLGYDVTWLTLGACAVGAAHHRHRVFVLATHTQWSQPRVTRLDGPQCGAKTSIVLTTVTRQNSHGPRLHDVAVMLPTPSANDYGSNQGGAAGRVGPAWSTSDGSARLDLLPIPTTPTVPVAGSGDAEYWARRRATGRDNGLPLDATLNLLPTPRATDGVNGGPGQRGSSGDLAMSSAVQPEHWGRFADAVARHAAIYGNPPAPTEPNRNGAPRLTAAFAEWLMCLPAGHVTATLDRREALAAIGNGVCPPQAATAWAILTKGPLDMSLGQSVPSLDMTASPTSPVGAQVAEIQQRQADARTRVVATALNADRSFAERNGTDQFSVGVALQAAFMELAAVWREEAAWWDASNRRGAKGNSQQLIQAASRLAGFAVGLAAEATSPAPVVPVDPIDDALPLVEQPHHQGDQPVQPAIIVDPFTVPAAPTRTRPDITRLTFADLPRLIGETYPVPRDHLSHSYVEDMAGCGLKALLGDASRREVIGPRRPSWAFVGGVAFHNAVESIERASLQLGGTSPVGELGPTAKFWEGWLDQAVDDMVLSLAGTPYAEQSTWHVPNKGLEGLDWWRVKGVEMIDLYHKLHSDAWRQGHVLLRVPDLAAPGAPLVPVLELAFAQPAGTTAVRAEGRIDAAWVAHPDPSGALSQYQTATIEVVDFKAGRSEPTDPFQLAEYAEVLRRHYLPANFALPIVGRHYYARKGIYSDPVPLGAGQHTAEIDFRYTQTDRATKAGVFLPNPSSFCSSCGLVDYCPTQSRRDAS